MLSTLITSTDTLAWLSARRETIYRRLLLLESFKMLSSSRCNLEKWALRRNRNPQIMSQSDLSESFHFALQSLFILVLFLPLRKLKDCMHSTSFFSGIQSISKHWVCSQSSFQHKLFALFPMVQRRGWENKKRTSSSKERKGRNAVQYP